MFSSKTCHAGKTVCSLRSQNPTRLRQEQPQTPTNTRQDLTVQQA